MNLSSPSLKKTLAFTLPELMITSVLFMLVIGVTVYTNIFGLRLHALSRSKLMASDDARRTISTLIQEIREANLVRIGSGDASSFVEVPPNSAQIGNAIQIYSSTNSSSFVRYYWDGPEQQLIRRDPGGASLTVVANAVTNRVIFRAEDFNGQILSNNSNNRVISLNLAFSQLQYGSMRVGSGSLYDFYQLRTKITRRSLL